VSRSRITVDLAAIRRNAASLCETAAPAELWAVVKADAYGHGAVGSARAALEGGASVLCVATAREGEDLREAFPSARILVMSPLVPGEEAVARDARLELALSSPDVPEGVDVHVKVDTGMGRWGMSLAEARTVPRRQVVGVMSHLASADEEDDSFAREQIARFGEVVAAFPDVTAHLANSAGTLRFPEARFDAVRCGIALYGLSPFGDDPADRGLEPALSWRSYVAQVRELATGESTGYGRRFVAERPTRIGIVPVGYADGFRRGLTGTEVRVGETRRRVVGTISMDSLAVELGEEPAGAEVTLIGDGILAEEHARVLGTINYEVACALNRDRARAEWSVVDG
jgi:alanine racemase